MIIKRRNTRIPRVLAAHDLSCFGRASLSVALPIFSHEGIELCPLPTAILSTHTGYSGFSLLPTTQFMPQLLAHWQKLNLEFDAMYTGFFPADKEIDVFVNFWHTHTQTHSTNPFLLVDPVMGDQGNFYPGLEGKTLLHQMKILVSQAHMITPNITEASFLLDKPYSPYLSLEKAKDYLNDLKNICPAKIILIKGLRIHSQDSQLYSVLYYEDTKKSHYYYLKMPQYKGNFTGAGDILASSLLAHLVNGADLFEALDYAYNFINTLIYLHSHTGAERVLSLDFEFLFKNPTRIQSHSYTISPL